MSRIYLVPLIACSLLLGMAQNLTAQTVIFDSGGFESYNIDTLSPQNGWLTTDLNQGSTPAGIVQSATTFAGSRAVNVIGPNLANDVGFSFQTFWYQDSTGTPFNPVLNGTPIVRTTWRQFVTGTTNNLSQMPFVGIYFEGFNVAGVQQAITSVFLDNADRVSAVTAGGNLTSSVVQSNVRNTWLDFRVDLNFSTQRFFVFLNNNLVLNNVAFRNTNGATNRLVEYGFQASAIDLISPPPSNSAFYDDYLITANAVPEPATFVLGGFALLAAAGYWRYRKTRQTRLLQSDVIADE